MTTDTSEKGLESFICEALTGAACDPPQSGAVYERPAGYGAGWIGGDPQDYDREYCIDLAQLSTFLRATQPESAESPGLDEDGPTRPGSWRGCRGKSPSAGPSTFCAKASSTARTSST